MLRRNSDHFLRSAGWWSKFGVALGLLTALSAGNAESFQLDGTVCGRLGVHRIKLTEGRKCAR